MKKIKTRNITILAAIIILVIIEIIAFGLSRAQNIKEIVLYIEDEETLVATDEVIMNAVDDEQSGYFITLPEEAKGKMIKEFIVEEKQINEKNEEIINEVTKLPGEKIYLTKEELSVASIRLKVRYDNITINDNILYNTKLTNDDITIEGYMPANTKIAIDNTENEEIIKIISEKEENITVDKVYSIKLMAGEEEYNPKEYNQILEVKIANIEEEKEYKILAINDNDDILEIENINLDDNTISFNTEIIRIYAKVIKQIKVTNVKSLNLQSVEEAPIEKLSKNVVLKSVSGGEKWDGTTKKSFKFGNGTQSNPYLITNGEELAYLAEQVKNGETYSGIYFQLTNDINLNNHEWTPIGTIDNSFRGIFDGAGYTISNGIITISNTNNNVEAYGIFGSVGGGSTYAIIKNVEFNSINVNLSVTRTIQSNDYGYKIGVVTGVMYNHSKVANVAVKNSNITHSGTITARYVSFITTTYYSPIIFMGGIAGDAVNTQDSETDPGNGSRAIIENCYSDVDMTVNVVAASALGNTNDGAIRCFAQVNIGGIIGRIKSQNTWPSNCLYTGSITSSSTNYEKGLVGPIFGAERNNTNYNSNSNINKIWNGDNSSSLTMNSYYFEYNVFRSSFTSSVTTGDAGTTTTYRRNTSSSNIGYMQGVNKGIYMSNTSNMVTNFNNNLQSDYVSWTYSNGELSLKPRLIATVSETAPYNYLVSIVDNYNVGNYTYNWYVNNALNTNFTGNIFSTDPNYTEDREIDVIVSDGTYFATSRFVIERLYIEIIFNIDENNNLVNATLTGSAVNVINQSDYTYKWYKCDASGLESGEIAGANSLTLNNLEKGMEYKIVATNGAVPQLSAENRFVYGDRIVVFVDYENGRDTNDGWTPNTACRTLSTAYSKLGASLDANQNIIVIMGDYTSNSYYNSATATTYAKNATLTGIYDRIDYNGTLYFGAQSSILSSATYRYLTGDTVFQYLEFRGSTSSNSEGNVYLLAQGHSLTMGEGLTMARYEDAPVNQGIIDVSSPAFHVFGGWYQYDYSTLPNNNSEIIIKSGTYARVIAEGTIGGVSSSNLNKTTSHDFTGSSESDIFRTKLTIDIKNSTTPSQYPYDVNLLVGGGTVGSTYANITEDIKGGKIGRVLGGSIGDSSLAPSNWSYPLNTFIGQTTINISGGTITELYGGCLGRNMNSTTRTCDSYFYGTININISGGQINNNIYGAGAGGVTGYNANSSDTYKSYGANHDTSVNINISGNAVINGDVYGGGYGYTDRLTTSNIAPDGGTLYGNTNITISENPRINGNIYGAGCGTGNYSSKTELAQMIGNTSITITGAPTIIGKVFGAGAGVSGYENMAKVTGNTFVKTTSNSIAQIYGGGNIAKTVGNTKIIIADGNHTAGDMYGGGNLGIVDGITTVYINGGTQANVYGGGNQATANESNVYVNGGTQTNVFAGGNEAAVSETNLIITGGQTTNIYGGGNKANVNDSNITIAGGTTGNIFGGSNLLGTINNSNITAIERTEPIDYGETLQTSGTQPNTIGSVSNIYGGNNAGGTVSKTDINIQAGNITNIYGGGNQAIVTNAKINISGGVIGTVYGGGNQAAVEEDTLVSLSGGQISGNVYGGGNEGTVSGDTIVTITDATILGSCYGGGNGATAIVSGNTSINIAGNTIIGTENSNAPAEGCVFGSGKAAATGRAVNNNSTSTVNIVGGNIYGNVYGGANTSVVYGNASVNIGEEAVNNSDLEAANIYIKGTIFGGGEANASGSENYDYSFISVTQGIVINIDGSNHENFATNGSILGSGNASSSQGDSYINIKNYGNMDNPQNNISIQRATVVTIDNSAIMLQGATDRTNEYSTTSFTLSRIKELKLKNSSCLYLNCGANMLEKLSSLVDVGGVETVAAVQIDEETGDIVSRNVDNRIYMLEGKNLNIAKNESVTEYGEIVGMTFLGLYTSKLSPHTSTGLYNHIFENEDEITNLGTFSYNSYVLGEHKANHNIYSDGFYTNKNNEGYIKTEYVGVTPEEDLYYIWNVGEQLNIKTFEVDMIASKYATLGTYELSLVGFSDPNIKFVLSGFSSGLESDVSLVDGSTIKAIADTEEIANTTFGLNIKSGKSGWETNNETKFYTANGGSYVGKNIYDSDNSSSTPTLLLCFFHSQNLSEERSLGTIKIRYQVLTPIDDLNYNISFMDIDITLRTALFQDDFYEAAISPGEEFDLFTTTGTTITDSSMFSTYYSLIINHFSESDYYDDYSTDKRALVSRTSNNSPYSFKAGTKITMLDLATNKYYYYVVSSNDEINNKYIYYFEDFIQMGSTNEYYDESAASSVYYMTDRDIEFEKFIFHVDFEEANITNNIIDNTLLIELHNADDETLIGVLGIERDTTKYSVYVDADATINVTDTIEPETVYLGDIFNLNVTTDFSQNIVNTKTIYDTHYFNKKMGIKITIYDSNGNQLNSDSLLGIIFELDGNRYYPRIDGSTRIKIADRVSNVLSRIKVNTTNNTTLATGIYTIKVETFGSPDGIYYGLESSASIEKNIAIINGLYGLKIATDDAAKIIDSVTGQTLENTNSLISTINYTSSLSHPRITVTLERRKYNSIYSSEYEKVALTDYVSNSLTEFINRENEYLIINNPASTNTFFLTMKDNLKTGTYKLTFKLYDGATYIGEAYEYFVIK